MDTNKNLEEQIAPEKNTDHAFVKVGKDGKPETPKETTSDIGNNNDNKTPEPGSMKDR